MINLRRYQIEAADAVDQAHAKGIIRPAVVLPTGTGKTTVIAELVRRADAAGMRTVTLAHRTEIVDQIADRLKAHVGPKVGIIAGSRIRPGKHTVAMVQTLRNVKRIEQLGAVGRVIVDECHHATAASYQTVLTALGSFDQTPAVGFTATMSRGDSARLGDTWDDVAYSKTIAWAISEGYLCTARGKAVVLSDLDLSTVRSTAGDYRDGELGEVIAAESPAIVRAWITHGEGRKTMAFVPTVEAANELADAFKQKGITNDIVIGTTPASERKQVYRRFENGHTQILISVSVLTEGFDMPAVSCVLMARPTKLAHVYVQAVGRGLRPAPGKTDCLVLDVVGVSRLHTLTTLTDLGTDAQYERVSADGDLLDDEVIDALGLEDQMTRMQGVEKIDDVDLFRSSDRIWLRTHGGVRFIPAGTHTIFLWPVYLADDEIFHIGVISNRGPAVGGFVLPDMSLGWLASSMTLPLEDARAIAEQFANDWSDSASSHGSPWRQGNRKPTDTQMTMARSLGIAAPEIYNKARLADEISIAIASSRLDI